MENPYAPTQTEPVQYRADGKPWPIWLAVLIGLVVDIASTIAISMVAVIAIFSILVANGTSIDDIDLIFDDYSPSTLFIYALGLGGSMLGGYVCGRLAAGRKLKAGVTLGMLTSALGVLTDVSTGSPALVLITMSGLTILVTIFGASLASSRAPRVEVVDGDASSAY